MVTSLKEAFNRAAAGIEPKSHSCTFIQQPTVEELDQRILNHLQSRGLEANGALYNLQSDNSLELLMQARTEALRTGRHSPVDENVLVEAIKSNDEDLVKAVCAKLKPTVEQIDRIKEEHIYSQGVEASGNSYAWKLDNANDALTVARIDAHAERRHDPVQIRMPSPPTLNFG